MKKIMPRIVDFGKGFGIALLIGIPMVAVLVTFKKPRLFAFGYMREVALLALWAAGIGLLGKLKTVKVGKSGVEFSLGAEPVAPNKAIPEKKEGDE